MHVLYWFNESCFILFGNNYSTGLLETVSEAKYHQIGVHERQVWHQHWQ